MDEGGRSRDERANNVISRKQLEHWNTTGRQLEDK